MIGESADTTQKDVSTLAKNQQLFSCGTETLFGQGYPWYNVSCLTVASQGFLSPV